ncbi:MAG TPA: ROK family protein, partial [Alphaproteobacteria bacterium]|nr:ROK family protein [Alphaproteobacteria bacterium]
MALTIVPKAVSPERESNRGRLLRQLRRHGPMARVDLGRRTGLSAAAVSTITSELIGNGVLVESADEPAAENLRGRPPVNLQLNPGYAGVAAASLRMDVVDAVVADFAGRILVREEFPCSTRALTGEQVVAQCAMAIDTVLSRAPGLPPSAIGLAVQGIIDPTVGRQVWSPILSIRDTDIVSPLADHFRVPIVMENDSAATALAAAQREPTLREGLVGVLMVGHGVGMGLLVDGGPFPGPRGASSEIGHVRRHPSGAQCRCGQRGCIEAYLADYALYRDARTVANLSMTSHQQPSERQMRDLVRRAEEGEPSVFSLFREAG